MSRIQIHCAMVVLVALGAGAGRARATNVGVVHVAQVSEKYLKTADLEGQFESTRRRLGQERDAMKEKVERANRALQDELKPGTDEFRQRKKEIAMMEAELQWFVESEGQKIEQGMAHSLRSIFDDIRAAVKTVATEKGLDVVLASDNLPADSPDSPLQVRQHILLQKVLYWNDKVDITNDVIARLNAGYKPSSGSQPAGAAPIASPEAGRPKPKDAKPDFKKP